MYRNVLDIVETIIFLVRIQKSFGNEVTKKNFQNNSFVEIKIIMVATEKKW